ncbi:MAG: Xaa-Pro peptidase family protein [Cyclobacteriaceae bacterium]|nr:Xaa-Pro peptidase family protein [Cyclobacteriaceae bacterium]MDH4298516.1 Xaa-Pro peptidase family protein [Cyclobacteriaceae bacterium]MDH5249734.1 Xaa-Pro peptidase family protein [Cyclobacteriaceae bacterium]
MTLKRRDFIQLSTVVAGTTLLTGIQSCQSNEKGMQKELGPDQLEPMTSGIQPITKAERASRIEKAQRLLNDQQMEALILDAGTSLTYFTGISWWPSERPMVAIIPSQGDVRYVCPGFEEARLRELITQGNDVYPWQEDESPYKQIALVLKDAGIKGGKVGVEERVRFFIVDGIRKESPHLDFVSADHVTGACRLIKSAAEIALMQVANDITTNAMKIGMQALAVGMSPADFSAIVSSAHQTFGAEHDFADVNFGEATAFPHGSAKPQRLKQGDIVLMDCGCRVSGYSSDISRTIVFGQEPTKRQLEIWSLEKEAQAAGFAAANLMAACEDVDAAARAIITNAGFGPGYKLPGLPHRTGHGIGMDGHEWGNMVKGNRQPLEPGMCFSIEPNISIPGEFGVRLEDCVYMTDTGPKWFSRPSKSIGEPFPGAPA